MPVGPVNPATQFKLEQFQEIMAAMVQALREGGPEEECEQQQKTDTQEDQQNEHNRKGEKRQPEEQ